MGEYADLVLQGVYCESCGCYTGREPGHPTHCDFCEAEISKRVIEESIEKGEKI